MLRLPESRRQIYYGGKKKPNIKKFLQDCNTMKINRQMREYERLQWLYRLYRMIELRRKFKDWNLYVKVKHIQRKYYLKYYLNFWKKCAIFKRYATFFNMWNNPALLLRDCIEKWHMTTLFLRSVEFYDTTLKRRSIEALKQWVMIRRRMLMRDTFDDWLKYLEMCKQLNKMVSFILNMECFFMYLCQCVKLSCTIVSCLILC